MDWSRIPLPLLAVVLLAAGAWEVDAGGGNGVPLMVLAAVMMGASLYQIAHDHEHDRHSKDEEE